MPSAQECGDGIPIPPEALEAFGGEDMSGARSLLSTLSGVDEPLGFVSSVASKCPLCEDVISQGSRVFPMSREAAKLGGKSPRGSDRVWAHSECAKAAGVLNTPLAGTDKPCKHWRMKGHCMFGDKCQFLHPPEAKGADAHLLHSRSWGGKRVVVRKTNRAWVLINFLLEEFGPDLLRSGAGVLDIAGGQGQVGFELSNLCGIDATILDPRVPNFFSCVRKFQLGMFHRNMVMGRFVVRSASDPIRSVYHLNMYITNDIVNRICGDGEPFSQEEMDQIISNSKNMTWSKRGLKGKNDIKDDLKHCDCEGTELIPTEGNPSGDAELDEETTRRNAEKEEARKIGEEICVECKTVEEMMYRMTECSFLVGMHPDQATECLVDLALKLNKPFAVVPCCVYSNLFTKRKLADGTSVRSYDQFVNYLLQKDSSIQKTTLEFGGRNVVLYRHAT